MLFENKEKMNKQKKLLYNRQPFVNRVRFDEILDIQLSLYEAMMQHELAKKATSD